MPDYFPQINGNLIMTQLPYTAGLSYESVVQDMETGMRYTFPRRGAGLEGYPISPLGKFGVSFSRITDGEVDVLQAFFRRMRGRWGTFRFLDPGGNLVLYSEDFSQSYWDKSTGPVTVGSHVLDPSGQGQLATALSAAGGVSAIKTQITPNDGGMNGFRLCVSAWVNARDAGTELFIGFLDSGGNARGTKHKLPFERWTRISHSETLWDDDVFRATMGGQGTWSSTRQIYTFGFQVSPHKGEGAYVKTPQNHGYHANCRFDTDVFERRCVGPNENSVQLPIVEFYVVPPEV